jgi:hypothetical protein
MWRWESWQPVHAWETTWSLIKWGVQLWFKVLATVRHVKADCWGEWQCRHAEDVAGLGECMRIGEMCKWIREPNVRQNWVINVMNMSAVYVLQWVWVYIDSEVLISEVQQRTENMWREMEAKVKLWMLKLIEEFSENVVNVYEDLEWKNNKLRSYKGCLP